MQNFPVAYRDAGMAPLVVLVAVVATEVLQGTVGLHFYFIYKAYAGAFLLWQASLRAERSVER